jgi:hypothetical protein
MLFRTSKEELVKSITKLVIDKVEQKKPEIEYWSQNLAKTQYSQYPRPPIDSGESLDETTTKVTTSYANLTANLEYKIDTNQAQFFTDPKSPENPNFKYGKRDPAKDSYDRYFKNMLGKILNS